MGRPHACNVFQQKKTGRKSFEGVKPRVKPGCFRTYFWDGFQNKTGDVDHDQDRKQTVEDHERGLSGASRQQTVQGTVRLNQLLFPLGERSRGGPPGGGGGGGGGTTGESIGQQRRVGIRRGDVGVENSSGFFFTCHFPRQQTKMVIFVPRGGRGASMEITTASGAGFHVVLE